MNLISKILIISGLFLLILGLFTILLTKFNFKGIPGDIYIKSENFIFYFPIMSSIILSIILSIIFSIFIKILKK